MVVHDKTDNEISDFNDLELAGVEPLTLEDITFTDSYVNQDVVRYSQFYTKIRCILNFNAFQMSISINLGKQWLGL